MDYAQRDPRLFWEFHIVCRGLGCRVVSMEVLNLKLQDLKNDELHPETDRVAIWGSGSPATLYTLNPKS